MYVFCVTLLHEVLCALRMTAAKECNGGKEVPEKDFFPRTSRRVQSSGECLHFATLINASE